MARLCQVCSAEVKAPVLVVASALASQVRDVSAWAIGGGKLKGVMVVSGRVGKWCVVSPMVAPAWVSLGVVEMVVVTVSSWLRSVVSVVVSA